MKNTFLLVIVLFFISSDALLAKHIIGGVITYEHKGDGNYSFTMKIYRDCLGGGAGFDGANGGEGAVICVFREINGTSTLVHQITRNLDSESDVAPPSYNCISLPPNICVEEGIYTFDYKIPDFPSNANYHVVYQRCCRNNTITNIVAPQNAGATYEIVITPEAQKTGNNSPVFKNFPPTVICANIPILIDHSAVDKENDSLYYRFCSPLYGGGPNTGSGLSDCEIGAKPNPACPPPYDTVLFKGGYSSRNPLGFYSMNINENTGLLTGEVKLLGQYVVGICVEEYRNGILLSKVFRDFQFNIATCNVLVDANIGNDTIVAKRFIINSCGNNKVTFDNKSTDKSKITSYVWDFNILGQVQNSTEVNPTITFPGLGKYTGRLIANPGQKPCTDTAYFEVNVYPDIEANFRYAYDTCVAGAVQFTDLSSTGSGQMKSWKWEYKDGTTSSIQNPKHNYKLPGNYNVRLTVQDINGCKEGTTKVIRYFPVPDLILVQPDTSQGCQPLTIKFNNLSSPIDDTYTFDWDLGDGTKSSKLSPAHTYEDIGIYSVKLNLTSPIGCKTSASFPNLISVKGSPIANYSYNPDKLSNFSPIASFTDKSKDAVRWSWQFGKGEGSSAARNPTYTFRDTGVHEVKLIVTHPSGCTDTIAKIIDVEPLVTYFLPNAFTPNFDGTNDEFKGVGNLFGMNDFKMTIWNRWGERVFETKDPREAWNGKLDNNGGMSPDGVYVYLVTFMGPRNKLFSYKGFATLVR